MHLIFKLDISVSVYDVFKWFGHDQIADIATVCVIIAIRYLFKLALELSFFSLPGESKETNAETGRFFQREFCQ